MYNLNAYQHTEQTDQFLVIPLDGKNLIAYQEDMLNENQLSVFLPFFSRFENASYSVYYNITGMSALTQAYSNSSARLDLAAFLNIMETTVNAMYLRDQYFLTPDSLLLHQDYIFTNFTEVKLTYVPANIEGDAMAEFSQFSLWLMSLLDSMSQTAVLPLTLLMREGKYTLDYVKETLQMVRITSSTNAQPHISQVYEAAKTISGTESQKRGRRKKYDDEEDVRGPRKTLSGLLGGALSLLRRSDDDDFYDEDDDIEDEGKIKRAKQKASGGRVKNAYLVGRGNELTRINSQLFTIGRADTSDFTINNPGVSRAHAELLFDGYELLIVDTNSTGGTYLNQARIKPKTPTRLKDNDVIGIYDSEFVVKIVDRDI